MQRPDRADWWPVFPIRCGCVVERDYDNPMANAPLLAMLAHAKRPVPSVENTTALVDGEWTRIEAGEWVLMPTFRWRVSAIRAKRGTGWRITRHGVDATCRHCNTRHLIDRDDLLARRPTGPIFLQPAGHARQRMPRP
jgi:hypothetical protein